MQSLVLHTALPIDLETGDWQTTTIGKKFSHTFGYGKIDTWATIEAAKTFKNLKPQAWFYSPWIHVKQAIPQGDEGLAVSFEVTSDMMKDANLERLEHVTVTMNANHTKRGDMSVELISPNKIVSHLATTRRLDTSSDGYDDWTFMSVVHWYVPLSQILPSFLIYFRGESGIGTWTLIVKDTQVNEHNGTFIDWHLKLFGESIDASKAKPLPMPSEHDDDNHDEDIATTTIAGTTTAITPGPTHTDITANPTDHPDRPVNAKPSGTGDEATPTETSAPAATTSPSSWLPSFFPTFGVSSKTQIWIYGAAALILVFCSCLGIYFYMARRKRLRNNPRDEWEFDLLEEDEADGLNGGPRMNGAGKKGGKRRAGELYDAFAAGSDDESEGEYLDDDAAEGGDEREKRLYEESDEDGDGQHVIGDDDEESGGEGSGNEKRAQGQGLLGK
jgi:kexin